MSYAKPGPLGGKLIREVISALRGLPKEAGVKCPELPITAHILIAVSGGCDSMALARLLVRYGRRVGTPGRIRLIHINHGWRGKESDDDERLVRAAARRWKVPVSVFRLKAKTDEGGSPEELARRERKRIFERLTRTYAVGGERAWILTAHHADDVAETLIWRFFTGTADTHGGGIRFQEGRELRPFLRVRKRELAAFLKEEGESWSEDRTNFEGRLLRSRLRLELMPILEHLFPRAVENLVRQAIEAQRRQENSSEEVQIDASLLFSAAGIRTRRAHWNWLKQNRGVRSGRLSLPGGWELRLEHKRGKRTGERWILERGDSIS